MSRRKKKVTKDTCYGEVQRAFLQVLQEETTATVDVIHEQLEIPDEARMSIGSTIGGLSRDGQIQRVDFTPAERGQAHGRHVAIWRLAD